MRIDWRRCRTCARRHHEDNGVVGEAGKQPEEPAVGGGDDRRRGSGAGALGSAVLLCEGGGDFARSAGAPGHGLEVGEAGERPERAWRRSAGGAEDEHARARRWGLRVRGAMAVVGEGLGDQGAGRIWGEGGGFVLWRREESGER